ncbi:MAG TPA: hypothetical protein VEU52_04750 [Candidatus Limnocylindrales bacterium]|nr:hypothetical protein [Candidatus Limnocylindrales bacterium]
MKSKGAFFLIALLIGAPCLAHVGSPDVYFKGEAGPYHVTVTIRTPPMIPGVAEIFIRSAEPGVRQIKIVPLYIVGPGSKYPPPPDALSPSKDDPQFFSGKLWLMSSGSWQVRIEIEGEKGSGSAAVPVPAFARNTLPMQKAFGALLLGLMIFLVAAVISIIGAAGRESKLAAGSRPGQSELRRARWTMAIAFFVVATLLGFGGLWWKVAADNLRDRMIYKPPPLILSVAPSGEMRLQIGESHWHTRRPETVATNLIPDHGHLMHLFLIRVPQMDRFYHLHPSHDTGMNFIEQLPAMDAGRYQVFADIVRESGFPDTLVAQVDIPAITGHELAGDDSEIAASPLNDNSAGQLVSPLSGGARMIWERAAGSLPSNQLLSFRFRVEDADGKPEQDLEPYMGMAGHAEFVRSDLSVFAHVHPDGSVSMAALQLADTSLARNSPSGGGTMNGMEGMRTEAGTEPITPSRELFPAEVSFPYGLPKPGLYRIFVQVKRAGSVETGVFDAEVK